jgi:chromosome segregation ATPase
LDDNCAGALNEIEVLTKRLQETEMDLHKARQSENMAFDEADVAQNDARNYREDLSFLTKETERLNNEVRQFKNDRVELEDELRRNQIEFQDYRESENVRYENF